jgi:ABC-2 type transport system ATP-binding protein
LACDARRGSSLSEAIKTEGLTKQYNGFQALDHLKLTVESGKIVGFLGPNGAGKTTTIKILTGLLRPSEGQAYIWGVDVEKEPEHAMSRVGAVVETPELYPELTPLEILTYVGRLREMSPDAIRDRSKVVLEEVKMSEWADKRTGKFSKGMKQRVGIAQALLNQPDLLILDEPTGGLDPRGMAEVRDVIKALGRSGITVFMSSHLLYEVQETCDSVALINKGKLLMYDDLARISLWRKGGRVEVEALPPIPPEIVERVQAAPGVKSVRGPDGNRIVVELEGGDEERAGLLRQLLGWGLRVRSFKDVEMPLESLYLELVKESR